ncbi:RidA family protein [Aspergillus affinis]|uniref:RidA family protein n=1 Tax=Aspergillus affinis TaxID=1070780 RepID=UPI0022FE1CD2|nr:Protein mmf1 [Aspergillus affinis]KAI9042022.1 Protein mmf1 [Aspergillus affinis]
MSFFNLDLATKMASRQAINRPDFLSPILSEAIVHNELVFCSGKIGVDAKTGDLCQTTWLNRLMNAMGVLKLNIQQVNIYLTNIADFAAMNAVYIASVPDPKPARVCVTVSELGRGAKVEIDCVAIAESAL